MVPSPRFTFHNNQKPPISRPMTLSQPSTVTLMISISMNTYYPSLHWLGRTIISSPSTVKSMEKPFHWILSSQHPKDQILKSENASTANGGYPIFFGALVQPHSYSSAPGTKPTRSSSFSIISPLFGSPLVEGLLLSTSVGVRWCLGLPSGFHCLSSYNYTPSSQNLFSQAQNVLPL